MSRNWAVKFRDNIVLNLFIICILKNLVEPLEGLQGIQGLRRTPFKKDCKRQTFGIGWTFNSGCKYSTTTLWHHCWYVCSVLAKFLKSKQRTVDTFHILLTFAANNFCLSYQILIRNYLINRGVEKGSMGSDTIPKNSINGRNSNVGPCQPKHMSSLPGFQN